MSRAPWPVRAAAHRHRADAFLTPHLARRRAGVAHPVYDFLFTYYNLRPAQLRRWHPGYGEVLHGPEAQRYAGAAGYERREGGMTVSRDHLESRRDTVTFIAGLLAATVARPPRFTCFGLHEWAMVYRADAVRHRQVPLRLGGAGTDAVVESIPLRCSHFDAYRFFTPQAVGRNAMPLTRAGQVDTEQPGCVHAGMDLYKWAFKLGPLIESTLVLDCLDLAVSARELDMRASPYDLAPYGFAPVRIETPEGRREYAHAQQDLAARAAPLRARLLDLCDALREAGTAR